MTEPEHSSRPVPVEPGGKWGAAAASRIGTFIVAVLCGIGVPLSPLAAEWFVTGQIEAVSWFAVGVTYVSGVGLVSKVRPIMVSALLAASVLAFVYGVDMQGLHDAPHMPRVHAPPFDPKLAIWMIGGASLEYLVERVGRHLVGSEPFLEA